MTSHYHIIHYFIYLFASITLNNFYLLQTHTTGLKEYTGRFAVLVNFLRTCLKKHLNSTETVRLDRQSFSLQKRFFFFSRFFIFLFSCKTFSPFLFEIIIIIIEIFVWNMCAQHTYNVGIKAMKIILWDFFPERFIIEFLRTDQKKNYFLQCIDRKITSEGLAAMIIEL